MAAQQRLLPPRYRELPAASATLPAQGGARGADLVRRRF